MAATTAVLCLAAAACCAAAPVSASAQPRSATDANCRIKAGGAPGTTYWPLTRLNYTSIWPITQGRNVVTGQPELVAVIDSGLNLRQPQLHAIDRAPYIDANTRKVNVAAIPDCVGHGTAVTGIIAAQRTSNPLVGVAPQARILAIKDTGNDGTGTAAALVYAIDAAADAGATVANISGGIDSPTPELKAALAHALAKDMVVVAAAGNDAQTTNAPLYPAALSNEFQNVLAVSAVDAKDDPGTFSTSGRFVSVAAPGLGIPGLGGLTGYTKLDGTSFAAPFVTGTVALIRAANPQMNAMAVVKRVEATADPPSVSVPDPALGYGVIDPYLAVTSVSNDLAPTPTAQSAAPLPARAQPSGPSRELQHVALAAAIGLLALAALAGVGAAVVRGRSGSDPARA